MTMSSPAGAIAWEFRRRHFWGGVALAGYFAVLALIKIAMLVSGRAVVFRDAGSFALVVVVPLTATFIYLLAVFSFGLDGDLAARQSMYPPRMFTLPVTSDALAGWPMAYGCVAALALWIATRICAIWPSGMPVPIIWPGLLAASLLAWTQALTWLPYPARGLRVIVAVLWLCTIDTIVLLALHFHARERVMLALLAPHVPLAFVAARAAVVRARFGAVSDVRKGIPDDLIERWTPSHPFRSRARAQVWFEWRRFGRSLPALVAMLLPFELSLLFIFRDTPALVLESLLIVFTTPGFMAGFVAATIGRTAPPGRDTPGLQPFLATRPLLTGSLVVAQIEAALWSTAAAWLLIALAVPLALTLSSTWPVVVDRVARMEYVFGTSRTLAIALAGGAGLIMWTWKRLVQGIYIGFTGREWLIKANVFGTLALLLVVGLLLWIVPLGAMLAAIWDALPWVLAAVMIMKLSAAIWIAVRGFNDRLIPEHVLLMIAACWSAGVFSLYFAFVWFVDTAFVPHYLLLLAAIVAVPLTRVTAGPVALAWNRHR